MRYLTEYFIRTGLHLGKAVEQFLGGGCDGEEPTIRWLVLDGDGDRFVLTYYEAFDHGSDSFTDIGEFPLVDRDADLPEHLFDTIEEALAYAQSSYGASLLRWVNQFVVEEEYRDYRRNKPDKGHDKYGPPNGPQ
jgi:hypothetical protein